MQAPPLPPKKLLFLSVSTERGLRSYFNTYVQNLNVLNKCY